ncbi:MAG: acylphosphatase [Armatimonadota bacterium]
MQRLRAIVTGRVQGVNFRYHTVIKARRLGIVGYVRNLPGGEVEVEAEGEREPLERLLEFLHRGPSHAHVRGVGTTWEEATGEWERFDMHF